ncbi:MAG: cell division protein FtsZ [Thaumarchaeota archaeon]|nr:cell division protein FtsZ [Nitrososphaerota archaeon]
METQKIISAVELARPSVSVVGVGGAGCNIVSWIKRRGIAGGKLIALNTDAAHLSITQADRRLLIGEKLTKGRGCGGYPERGEQAALESLEEVKREVHGANIAFVCAGLGGGTGTGGAKIITEEFRKTGALVVGVVTLPFSVEKYRYELAKEALKSLRNTCDTVVAIDNTKLSKVAGDLPLQQALGVANELVGQFVKGITETITTASLINIDFADLRAIMERRGIAAIGVGEKDGNDRIESAVRQALDSQLLDIKDITKSRGVLVHVSGGEDVTLEEVTRAGELVTRSLPPNTRIVWGARVDPSMNNRARVMVVLTGVESTFISEQSRWALGALKIGVKR